MPPFNEAEMALRRRGIGGSEVGILMGTNRYMTPFDLYMSKVQGIEHEVPEFVKNAGWWGHKLEDDLADWFLEHGPFKRAGIDIIPFALNPQTLWSVDRPWEYCSPDRLLTTTDSEEPIKAFLYHPDEKNPVCLVADAGMETKTRSVFAKKYWGIGGTKDAKIPEDVYDQVQWSMGITGLDMWYVVLCLGGQEGRWYGIHYDKDRHQRIQSNVERFWHFHVLAENTPFDWEVE